MCPLPSFDDYTSTLAPSCSFYTLPVHVHGEFEGRRHCAVALKLLLQYKVTMLLTADRRSATDTTLLPVRHNSANTCTSVVICLILIH